MLGITITILGEVSSITTPWGTVKDNKGSWGGEGGLSWYALTWRVGALSKEAVSRVISTLRGILIGVMILISLQNKYLLSPPTLQVAFSVALAPEDAFQTYLQGNVPVEPIPQMMS